MDNPQTITAVEWFFGYGGNHLGLKRVLPSLRCIAACEIEGYANANLVSKIEAGKLDAFPIWSDCKTFPCAEFHGLVDIFIASYPCQPFSSAGKRGGEDDPRHLWPFVRRAIEIIRPRYCFFENVEGHVSQGLREVLTELVMLGYRVENSRGEPTFGIFSAAEVGAPQQRKRVFILAELEDTTWGGRARGLPIRPGRQDEAAVDANGRGQGVGLANTECSTPEFNGPHGGNGRLSQPSSWFWPDFVAGPGQPQHEWEPARTIETIGGLGGGVNGRAANVDRLRLLGNGVYPATAAKAFLTLYRRLTE